MIQKDAKLTVIKDCPCLSYTNELLFHYRSSIQKRELNKGDIVTFVEEWSNCYGRYYRVHKENDSYLYDIKPENLKVTY